MPDTTVAVVIEDEEDIRDLIATVLEQAGYTVHTAATGMEGVELVRVHQPVVTTVDVSMPGMDGFETARRIRTFSSTYLVMLTARTDEIDTIQGLQAGADDYVSKPFRPRELRARIEAMRRRPRTLDSVGASIGYSAGSTGREQTGQPSMGSDKPPSTPSPPSDPPDSAWLEHRGLRLHPHMRLVTRHDEPLDLTRSEFDILCELLQAGRRVLSKADLVLVLRGDQHLGSTAYVTEHDTRAIEVHVANLRRKLGETPSRPQWVETIRGVGYRLTAR